MSGAWKIRASRYLLRTPYLNLRRDACDLPGGGHIADYYVVEEADYGMVFALTAAQEVVMVRQYKHGIGTMMLELPAGYIDPSDEDPAAGCLREFREETGCTVAWHQMVGTHARHPTRNTNQGHLLVATGAKRDGAQSLDANEAIEVLFVPLDAAFEKIHRGEITAVGTIACLYLGRDVLARAGRL